MSEIPEREWKVWEEQMLRYLFYRGENDAYIGTALYRSENSIRSYRQKNNLTVDKRGSLTVESRKHRQWQTYEVEWLKHHVHRGSLVQLGETIGRSEWSVMSELYGQRIYPIRDATSELYPRYQQHLEEARTLKRTRHARGMNEPQTIPFGGTLTPTEPRSSEQKTLPEILPLKKPPKPDRKPEQADNELVGDNLKFISTQMAILISIQRETLGLFKKLEERAREGKNAPPSK